jgi:hypothetical protein
VSKCIEALFDDVSASSFEEFVCPQYLLFELPFSYGIDPKTLVGLAKPQ